MDEVVQLTAFKEPVSVVRHYKESVFLAADDEGTVKLFDMRKKKAAVRTWKEHGEYINDACCNPGRDSVVAVGGDGHLGVWDVGSGKLFAFSDHLEDEPLSCAMMKDNSWVGVGTATGMLCMF